MLYYKKMILWTENDFNKPVQWVAQKLIGSTFYFYHQKGIITETEAYSGDGDDFSSHSYKFRKSHTRSLFHKNPGHLYIYFTYGLYYCMNIIAGSKGSAVLIRSIIQNHELWINGPAKICHYLNITMQYDGESLIHTSNIYITHAPSPVPYITTPRIGITQSKYLPWRFVIEKSTLQRYYPKLSTYTIKKSK